MYETQLIAQQNETKAAIETLQDAATEMEVSYGERKSLTMSAYGVFDATWQKLGHSVREASIVASMEK